eukprot:GHVP01055986.1.p1 GENE.GHVP01055986.1~~GHVP01055986.1.p1  ORF type:complete len:148 (+),score=15.20 GHVP01055986.1:308-751(+)
MPRYIGHNSSHSKPICICNFSTVLVLGFVILMPTALLLLEDIYDNPREKYHFRQVKIQTNLKLKSQHSKYSQLEKPIRDRNESLKSYYEKQEELEYRRISISLKLPKVLRSWLPKLEGEKKKRTIAQHLFHRFTQFLYVFVSTVIHM